MLALALLVSGGAVAVYSGLLLLLWRFQERIVFQPPADVAPMQVAARQVRYTARDGVELFAYVVGNCVPSRPVMIAFHGNADVARWLIPWALNVVRETGACVVLPEYRGYDGLSGVPSYSASELDARAVLQYVRTSTHATPDRLVYFGHSLGSAIATELASTAPPRALILQSPFSSAREMGNRLYLPGLAMFWGIVSRVHFNTIGRVASLATPVWVAHGDKDIVVPVYMGREVFAAAKEKGELLVIHNAGHNDVQDVGGSAYWSWMKRAVRGVSLEISHGARAEIQSEP